MVARKVSFGCGATLPVPWVRRRTCSDPDSDPWLGSEVASHCCLSADLSIMWDSSPETLWGFFVTAGFCLSRVHTQVLSTPRGVWPHLWPLWLLWAAHSPGFLSGVGKAPPNTQFEFIYFQRLPGTGELHCRSQDSSAMVTCLF